MSRASVSNNAIAIFLVDKIPPLEYRASKSPYRNNKALALRRLPQQDLTDDSHRRAGGGWEQPLLLQCSEYMQLWVSVKR
jgi:hypothetical protein